MAVKIRRIDFSPDEWMGGTIGLTSAERGLYITACAMIYSHAGPIKISDLFSACVDHGNSLKSQLSSLVEKGKLLRKGDEIDQKRARNELEKARKRSANGRKNVGKRWKNNALEKGVVIRGGNANHQPSTTNHQPVRKKGSAYADPKKDGDEQAYAWRMVEYQGQTVPEAVPDEWIGQTYQSHPLVDGYAASDAFAAYWTEGKGAGKTRTERGWRQCWRGWIAREKPGRSADWINRFGYRKHLHGTMAEPIGAPH